jgi:hypothetical protein
VNSGGSISGSQASGNVIGTDPNGSVGGFVGQNLRVTDFATGAFVVGDISDSIATGNVTGAAGAQIGGFAGYNNFGNLAGDISTGDVFVNGPNSGPNGNAGGFVGLNFFGTITDSLGTGEVNGQPGKFAGSDTGTITGSTYDDVKADARAAAAKAAAEAAAQAAADARAAAAQSAQTASRTADTVASNASAPMPPDPSLGMAGTQATSSPNTDKLDAGLKTIKDGAETDDRREHRRVTAAATTQKPRAHRGSGGSDLGATIRSIDVDGQRFDLKDSGKKDAPGPKP